MASIINANTSGGLISTGDTSGQLQLQTVGTTALTVTSAQKVGVGTTSPLGTLGVVGSATTTIIIPCSSNGTTGSPVETQLISSTYTNGSYGAGIYALNAFNSTSANWLAFKTTDTGNGSPTTQMTLDASGNLGVGITTPGSKLEVSNTVNTAYDSTNTLVSGQTARVTNSSTTSGIASTLFFKATGSGGDNSYATISCVSLGTGASALTFGVKVSSGNSPVEAMRVDPSGNLLVGSSSTTGNGGRCQIKSSGAQPGLNLEINAPGGTQNVLDITNVANAAMGQMMRFWINGYGATQVGGISTTTSTTSYNTSSDYRLKNTIAPMTGALAKVALLKPVTYKWNSDGSDGQGFIAHELQEIVPECVTGEKDGVDEDGNPRHQGIDTSFLVATLTAAIQELSTQVTELKAEVQSLKGA